MREILFRAKRHKSYDLVYWITSPSIIWRANGNVGLHDYNSFSRCDPKTIGQYTGLKDKNNLKIFEGDIIKIEKDDYYPERIGIVSFKLGTFCLVDENGEKVEIWDDGQYDHYSLETIETFNLEIIGNIHDNPELLKS